MDKLIQRSLHKGGINRTEWLQSYSNNNDDSRNDNHKDDADEGVDNG